jgi:hypothetical protein
MVDGTSRHLSYFDQLAKDTGYAGSIETSMESQGYLPGCRPDTVIITNIGQGQHIDTLLKRAGAENYLQADAVIGCCHERGSDELANRALKDFGHEQLPFKRFNPNAASAVTSNLAYPLETARSL